MKRFFLSALVLLMISSASHAAEPSVEVAAVATSIEKLTPLGVSDKFPAGTERLYCYSRVVDAEGQNIKHLWYINEKQVDENVLSIKGKRYRTYSLLVVPKGSKGTGRCDVTTMDGKLLKSVDFMIE